MDRGHYQNNMGDIEHFIDPEGPILSFKYDWLFEKQMTI